MPINKVLRIVILIIIASIKNMEAIIITKPSKKPKIVHGHQHGPDSGITELINGLTTLSSNLVIKYFTRSNAHIIEVKTAISGHITKQRKDFAIRVLLVSEFATSHATMHEIPKQQNSLWSHLSSSAPQSMHHYFLHSIHSRN